MRKRNFPTHSPVLTFLFFLSAIQHTTEPQPVPSTSTPLGDNSVPEVPVQIVSNARGPYPQLEMFSVPRRHNTHLGHGSSHKRGEKTSEDLTARALSRITKRLADVSLLFIEDSSSLKSLSADGLYAVIISVITSADQGADACQRRYFQG